MAIVSRDGGGGGGDGDGDDGDDQHNVAVYRRARVRRPKDERKHSLARWRNNRRDGGGGATHELNRRSLIVATRACGLFSSYS